MAFHEHDYSEDYMDICACCCYAALQSVRPSWSGPAVWWCWQMRAWSSTVLFKETLFPLSDGGEMILTCLRAGNTQRPSIHIHIIYHANTVFQLCLSSLDCACPSCLQIWNPRGPYLDCSPSDVFRWGLLYMCGGEHGWKVWSIRHAHCTRSVRPDPHM